MNFSHCWQNGVAYKKWICLFYDTYNDLGYHMKMDFQLMCGNRRRKREREKRKTFLFSKQPKRSHRLIRRPVYYNINNGDKLTIKAITTVKNHQQRCIFLSSLHISQPTNVRTTDCWLQMHAANAISILFFLLSLYVIECKFIPLSISALIFMKSLQRVSLLNPHFYLKC